MNRKAGKMFLLTGMLCIISFAVCACGRVEEAAKAQEPQAVQGASIPEDDTGEDGLTSGPEAITIVTGPGSQSEGLQSSESSDKVTDSAQKEQPEAQEIPADWAGSIPNLEGDIKDLQNGQFTVIEAMTEKSDNGGDILVSPGSGDDSEFNRISVSYDENTLFAIQTIYDGGARSELSAATAADLASGQFVHVWGSPSGSGMKATRICITKVM